MQEARSKSTSTKERTYLGDNNASEAGPNKDEHSLPNTSLLVSLQYFQKGVAKCQNVYFLGIVGVAVGVVVICPNTGLRQHLGQHVFIAEPVRPSAPWLLISLVICPSPRRLCFDSVHCNDATVVLACSFFSCVESSGLLDVRVADTVVLREELGEHR